VPQPELPMAVYTGRVTDVVDLSPTMRRVVLDGPGLAGYASTGVGDEYVRLVFPAPGAREPVLPSVTDGCLDFDSIDLATMRTYTIRDFDRGAGRVTIDFVVHDGGVAASWALGARPGDLVGINTPDGMYDPPPGLRWQVLVADCAALPAAARLLETAPTGVRTRCVFEVPDDRHRIPLTVPSGAEVTWVHGGNGHEPSRLEEIVRSLPRPDTDARGAGYIWVAGETRVLRGVRTYLRRELGLPVTAYKAVGYWTDHAEDWNERYRSLDASTLAALDALWEEDRPQEDLELEYDEKLAQLGL
jgi:NADPH-dependent ferric siderophore reductase